MKMVAKVGLVGLALVAACGVANADPVTLNFTRITANASQNVEAQLSVIVSDAGAGLVDFKFLNNVGTAASITDVYFADGTLLAIAQITSSAGVDFSVGANPANLPGGNGIGFFATTGFTADSNPPASANGVNTATEWLNIRYSLQGGQTFDDTIASLYDGSLRVGMHVQAIGDDGDSDGFVNTVTIPLPTTAGLGLAGLGAVAIRRRRK
jgi:hypothetical protein